ncbi:MAG: hypothetical protein U0326_04450 [Polyangiales bacterium]
MRRWITGLLFVCACSGATMQGGAHELRPLERVRMVRVIEEALSSRGLSPRAGRAVRIVGRKDVDCDVVIGATSDCVEYANSADRARYGAAIPPHTSPDALVVVAGSERDTGGHVLVLDDRDYVYEPDPNRTGPGRPSVGEVEDRARRTVVDFAAWLMGNRGR